MSVTDAQSRVPAPRPVRGALDRVAAGLFVCAVLALLASIVESRWGLTHSGYAVAAVEDAAYHWEGGPSGYQTDIYEFYWSLFLSAAVFAPVHTGVAVWLFFARSVTWPRGATVVAMVGQLCVGLPLGALQELFGTDTGVSALTSSAAIGSYAWVARLSLGGVVVATACSIVASILVLVAMGRSRAPAEGARPGRE